MNTGKRQKELADLEAAGKASKEQKSELQAIFKGRRCPECGSDQRDVSNIKDEAFSIHYHDKKADFHCRACGYDWHGQHGDTDPT